MNVEKNKDEFADKSVNIVNDVFKILEIKLEEISEQERQIIAAFSFGMVNAYALEEEVEQAKVQGVMIGISINIFKYSEKQAVDFTQMLINSTKREYHPTMYTIIHRGVQAYYDYKENKENDVYDNLTYIIDMVVNKR